MHFARDQGEEMYSVAMLGSVVASEAIMATPAGSCCFSQKRCGPHFKRSAKDSGQCNFGKLLAVGNFSDATMCHSGLRSRQKGRRNGKIS